MDTPDVNDHQTREFNERDAPRKRFCRKPNQIGGGTAEDKKSSRSPFLIDKYSQNREKLGKSLRFVDDHRSIKGRQAQRGFTESAQVSGVLKIEDVALRRVHGRSGKCRLACLPWAGQDHYRSAN